LFVSKANVRENKIDIIQFSYINLKVFHVKHRGKNQPEYTKCVEIFFIGDLKEHQE
jgi:hypothetical protein